MTPSTDIQATVPADSDSDSDARSSPTSAEQLAVVAGLGWLGVGIEGVWEVAGGGWPYLLFAGVLLLAVVATIGAAWSSTGGSENAVLRRFGLGLGALAIAGAVVAWALPLWMTLVAVSCLLFAAAAPGERRPGLVAVGAGQLVGMGVMFAAMLAEVGEQDSYGDHPDAVGFGLVVAGAGSVVGLAVLARSVRR